MQRVLDKHSWIPVIAFSPFETIKEPFVKCAADLRIRFDDTLGGGPQFVADLHTVMDFEQIEFRFPSKRRTLAALSASSAVAVPLSDNSAASAVSS
jgi:hypothetical protein